MNGWWMGDTLMDGQKGVGWMGKRMAEWMGGQMYEWTGGWIDTQMNK